MAYDSEASHSFYFALQNVQNPPGMQLPVLGLSQPSAGAQVRVVMYEVQASHVQVQLLLSIVVRSAPGRTRACSYKSNCSGAEAISYAACTSLSCACVSCMTFRICQALGVCHYNRAGFVRHRFSVAEQVFVINSSRA